MRKQTFRSQRIEQDDEDTIQKYNGIKSQSKEQTYNSTPRPQRKIVLYDQYNQKHFFPLYKDREIGIKKEYQDIVIESWNDDDKKTSST